MVNAGLGITVMADWIVEPYLAGRNIVVKPLHHSVARRAWFAATCKQTPAIQNFLERLKLYFSGADMDVEESEKKQIVNEHAIKKHAGVMIDAMTVNRIQDIRNYQY